MNYYEKYKLGTFYIDGYIGEKLTDSLTVDLHKVGTVTVEIYDIEGQYSPHVHIFNADRSFNCCICLTAPMYFKHSHYTSEMTSDQLFAFNTFMSEANKRYFRRTGKVRSNWEVACDMWVYSANDQPILIDKQPDYTTTVDSIYE